MLLILQDIYLGTRSLPVRGSSIYIPTAFTSSPSIILSSSSTTPLDTHTNAYTSRHPSLIQSIRYLNLAFPLFSDSQPRPYSPTPDNHNKSKWLLPTRQADQNVRLSIRQTNPHPTLPLLQPPPSRHHARSLPSPAPGRRRTGQGDHCAHDANARS